MDTEGAKDKQIYRFVALSGYYCMLITLNHSIGIGTYYGDEGMFLSCPQYTKGDRAKFSACGAKVKPCHGEERKIIWRWIYANSMQLIKRTRISGAQTQSSSNIISQEAILSWLWSCLFRVTSAAPTIEQHHRWTRSWCSAQRTHTWFPRFPGEKDEDHWTMSWLDNGKTYLCWNSGESFAQSILGV